MREKVNPDIREKLLYTLPVYQLVGGTESQRQEFIRALIAALDRCQVCVKHFRFEDPTPYAVLTQVKLFDLVLIDRPVGFTVKKIFFDQEADSAPNDLVWSGGGAVEHERFVERLLTQLSNCVVDTPVWACVLIGGKSSRMGQPKHMLSYGKEKGITWLEHIVSSLEPVADGIVLSGGGELPEKCAHLPRLVDIPGVGGPLSGILAASRWQPLANWLVVACDMPAITAPAISWLLNGRRAGCWGRVPRLADSEYCEPLLALYDYRAGQLFEGQLLRNMMRIGESAKHLKVDNPIIPESISGAWQNVNTPAQLEQAQRVLRH